MINKHKRTFNLFRNRKKSILDIIAYQLCSVLLLVLLLLKSK